MKKGMKKLVLHRETLRHLSELRLNAARGGSATCPTEYGAACVSCGDDPCGPRTHEVSVCADCEI